MSSSALRASREMTIYQVDPVFIEETTEERRIGAALDAIKAGRFGQAGALVRTVKDGTAKKAAIDKILAQIEALNAKEPTKAYDGMHAFLDNILVPTSFDAEGK